jgi:malonyl-CoA/methylmalonyl-CoA synthetase
MSTNLYQILRDGFQNHLDKPCLKTPDGQCWTFGELDVLSARFCALLKTKGLQIGDRIVVQADKSVGCVALYLATLRLGAIYCPLNTAYTAKEVEYFLSDTTPKLFVARPQSREELSRIAATQNCEIAVLDTTPLGELWAEALDTEPDHEITSLEPSALAAIVYTSGTTGRSKGAMISHRALIYNVETLHDIWGFEDGDVLIHALPIYHVHGLFFAIHTALLNASTTYFHPGFDAAQVKRDLKHATVLMGVPTFYSRLLAQDDFGPQDCGTMRVFISGSAPLTAQASEEWTKTTGHPILERYGMSEAGIITSNPLKGDRVPGTVGFALPNMELKVCDEAGNERPAGQIGMIEIRGEGLFEGYWQKPEKTAEEVRPDGFFTTGDMGLMDETGRVSIVGRDKDLIISGGFNIYPKEIESVLDDIEGIKETAVIGAPHADLGEGVVAVLVPDGATPDQSGIQAALDEMLARFKHPRRFYWVDALPRNAMGKVQKPCFETRTATLIRLRPHGPYQALLVS